MDEKERAYWEDKHKAQHKEEWDRNWKHHQNMINQTSNKSAGCFTDEMRVKTPHGWVSIAKLGVGDTVEQMNFGTGDLVHRRILRVKKYRNKKILNISAQGLHCTVRTTWAHPFGTQRGWVLASQLKPKHRLITPYGLSGSVVATPTIKRRSVTNLEVEGNNTFIVEGCLVHARSYVVLVDLLQRWCRFETPNNLSSKNRAA
ncbi:MAG: Hint domain-containing protein [Thalassovita sp.]